MSGAICEVLCDVVNRHFGPNGMLYCSGLLDRCNCGKCKSCICGEGASCQCTDCMNCQTTFYRAHPCTCLNNHPYRLGTCRDVDAYCEVLFCSVCRKIIYSEGPQAFFYMLMCENCLSFVCPACILRVMSPREKVLDGAVIPRFPPIGPPKRFVCEGSIYCGLLKNQCRCGMCDGRCGSTNGCA